MNSGESAATAEPGQVFVPVLASAEPLVLESAVA
jgi:hypothetical protein